MTKEEEIAEQIYEMFDGASTVNSTKVALISFLQEVSNEACNEKAGAVADTLLENLDRFSSVYCSDKQAYVLACAAIEHKIEL